MQNFIAAIHSKGFKKYFTNTSWLFVDNALNLIIGFGIGILVARYLEAEQFGLLNFAKSIAKFFSIFCALGLEKIVIKKLLFDNENVQVILGTSLTLKIIAALISLFTFAIVGSFFFPDSLTFYLILAFVSLTLFESFVVIRFFFQSKVQSRFIARVVLFKVMFSSLLKLLIIYLRLPLIFFAYEAIIEAIVGVLGYIYVYHKKTGMHIRQWKVDFQYGKSLLSESWPLIMSSFVVFVYMEIDIVMLKYMIDNSSVGHYAIAVRLTNIWHMIGIVICSSLFPAVLNAKSRDIHTYQSRFLQLLRLLVVISIVVVVGVFLLSDWIIPLLFGTEYLPSVLPLKWLIWSVIFVNLGLAAQQWFIAENLQHLLLMRTSAGAFINLVLNIILIPKYGIVGAAIATLAAQVSATFLLNVFSKQTRSLFLMQARSFLLLNIK